MWVEDSKYVVTLTPYLQIAQLFTNHKRSVLWPLTQVGALF